jgi:tRNA1(Val) A37 N6-methylase TrmN6
MKSNFAAIDSGETKTIHDFIERHLEPNEREKKLFGEVFTPLPLVQEMLGSIEKYADKDFWKNPNLKILDPAAGIGNFPLIAYEKLMEGLKSVKGFKGEEARRKHILEKMLYMVELNPNNVRLMNKIFNGKKYKLNVLCTDFLLETDEDVKKHEGLSPRQKADGKRLLEWKTMKFDLVMGNPPFQEIDQDTLKQKSSNANLWSKFFARSLTLLVERGCIAMVLPFSFGTPNSDTLHSIMKNNLLVLNTNIRQHFPEVNSSFCFLVVSSSKMGHSTVVNEKTINLKNIKVTGLPKCLDAVSLSINEKFFALNSLLKFTSKGSVSSSSHHLRKTQSSTHTYKIKHTNIEKVTIYSDVPAKNQSHAKILVNKSGRIFFMDDSKGEFGTTEGTLHFLLSKEDNVKQIMHLLNSKLYQFILHINKHSGFNSPALLGRLPLPIHYKELTSDEAIFQHFKLTSEEKNYIKDFIDNHHKCVE